MASQVHRKCPAPSAEVLNLLREIGVVVHSAVNEQQWRLASPHLVVEQSHALADKFRHDVSYLSRINTMISRMQTNSAEIAIKGRQLCEHTERGGAQKNRKGPKGRELINPPGRLSKSGLNPGPALVSWRKPSRSCLLLRSRCALGVSDFGRLADMARTVIHFAF